MRYQLLDVWRWSAILAMVAFHFYYDVTFVSPMGREIGSHSLRFRIGRCSAIAFLLVSGTTFAVVSRNHFSLKKYRSKGAIIASCALWISLVTRLFMPSQFIVFGILHFFAVSFFLLPFFQNFGYRNILIGPFFLWLWSILSNIFISWPRLVWLGVTYPWFTSADYYPLLPRLGVVLIGYSLGKRIISNPTAQSIFSFQHPLLKTLARLGKHSLLIYLIHQPVLLWIVRIIVNKR